MKKFNLWVEIFLAAAIGVFAGWRVFHYLSEQIAAGFWQSACIGAIASACVAGFLVDTREVWQAILTAWTRCVFAIKTRVARLKQIQMSYIEARVLAVIRTTKRPNIRLAWDQFINTFIKCWKKLGRLLKKGVQWILIIISNTIVLGFIGFLLLGNSGSIGVIGGIIYVFAGIVFSALWTFVVLLVRKFSPLQIPLRMDVYFFNTLFNDDCDGDDKSLSFSAIEKLFLVVFMHIVFVSMTLYILCTLVIATVAAVIEIVAALFNLCLALATNFRLSAVGGSLAGYATTFMWDMPNPWQVSASMLIGGVLAIAVCFIRHKRMKYIARRGDVFIHLGFWGACLK